MTRAAAIIRARLTTVTGALPTALYIVGAATASFGVWLAWHPAGYMFAGGVMVNAALKLGAAGPGGR